MDTSYFPARTKLYVGGGSSIYATAYVKILWQLKKLRLINLGVMVFRDAYRKENILRKYVIHERLEDYISGINNLKKDGWDILGIVCDGKRGLFNAFGKIPVQMCQFHQIAIVTRYITKNPKLKAGQDLPAR
jgi:hypothetical protein